ncbi:MAG: DUF975 family protein [Clostridiales Family XIII bacterium]|nr:DUF975 family protein [Clostridiales Family XIII bacterium]
MEEYILVTEPAREIRRMARAALKGHWKTAILAYVLCVALLVAPIFMIVFIFGKFGGGFDIADDYAFGGGIALLYIFVIIGPLLLGGAAFFLALVRGETPGHDAIFGGFNNFFRALGLFLLAWIFEYLWSMLFLIPGIIAAYAYTQTFFLLADNPQTGPFRAIRRSRRLMVGNKWKFFCLQISFIGWSLLLYAVYFALMFPFSVVPLTDLTTVLLILVLTVVLPAPLVVYAGTSFAVFHDILTGRRCLPAAGAGGGFASGANDAEARRFSADAGSAGARGGGIEL